MTTYTNTLVLELLVRSNELSKGLKAAGSDLRKANEEMNTFRESASRALSFAGTIGLGAGVIVGIKKATTAYGEFVNQAATAKQVFGDSFGELEKTMQGAVKQFGLSNTQFLQSTTLLAGLGKSAGIAERDLASFSTKLTTIASDLAAAFNTDVVDAVSAIQSGFSGSSIEPLRKYNIVLNDTILKNEYFALTGERVTGVLTQQQRMAAFLSKLTKESADYTGQWSRENEQFLGTMQRLQATVGNASAEIGRSFEPVITSVANTIIPLVSGLSDLNSELGGLPAQMALFAGALAAARTPLTVLDAGLLGFMNRQKTFGPTLTKSANAARLATNALSAVGPTTMIGAAAMTAFAVNTAVARQRADELKKAIDDLGKGSAADQIKSLNTVLEELQRNADSNYDFSEVWKGTIRDVKEVEKEYAKLLETSPQVAQAILAIAKRGGEGAAMIEQYGLTIAEMEAALKTANEEAEQQATLQSEIDTILAETTGTVEENADAWKDLSGGLKDITGDINDAVTALGKLEDATGDAFATAGSADLERLKVFQEMQTWIDEAFAPREEGETELERQIANGENFQNVLEQIRSAADTATEGLTGLAEVDAKVSFLTSLRDEIALTSPELAAAIDGWIADLSGVRVEMTVADQQAQAQIDAFVAANSSKEAVTQMLVETGVAQEDVEKFLSNLSDQQVIELTTKAITTLAEEDIDALNDADRVAEVTVEALVEGAQKQIDDVVKPGTSDAYIASAKLEADVDQFVTDVNTARKNAGKEIIVPIRLATVPGRTSSTSTLPDLNGDGRPGRALGGDGTEQLVINGQSRTLATVSAGRPITNVYVTVPTADPSATVRAIQRWSRDNGAIPISRGRG